MSAIPASITRLPLIPSPPCDAQDHVAAPEHPLARHCRKPFWLSPFVRGGKHLPKKINRFLIYSVPENMIHRPEADPSSVTPERSDERAGVETCFARL